MILWNITSLNGRGYSINIQGKEIRPGKFINLMSPLGAQDQKLLGTCLHIGPEFPSPLEPEPTSPLSKKECLAKLKTFSKDKLILLSKEITPSLSYSEDTVSRFWLESKILLAIFSPSFLVSPKHFLWTNHWKKVGEGFVEVT